MRVIDSNIIIRFLRNDPPSIRRKFSSLALERVAIAAISEAELRYGIERSARCEENHEALNDILTRIAVLPFDSVCARAYGRIRAELASRGTPIGPFDALIAATALAHEAIVVTDDVAEYARVPGLRVENWLKRGRA